MDPNEAERIKISLPRPEAEKLYDILGDAIDNRTTLGRRIKEDELRIVITAFDRLSPRFPLSVDHHGIRTRGMTNDQPYTLESDSEVAAAIPVLVEHCYAWPKRNGPLAALDDELKLLSRLEIQLFPSMSQTTAELKG